MKASKLFLLLSAAFACMLWNSSRANAQQQEDDAPKPAARAYPTVLDTGNGDDQQASDTQDASAGLQPDTRPLTGLQDPTLGSQEYRHSYWIPGFHYGSLIQSNAFTGSASSGWVASNYFVGNLSLLATGSHSQLSLNYSGGGFFSTDSQLGSGSYQELAVEQDYHWGRTQLQFLDQFSYLPSTQFGFGGASGLAVPGIGSSMAPQPVGLANNIGANQTIFSSNGAAYDNTFATQATYALSSRASVTVSGAYSNLNFVNAGNIDVYDAIGNVGYNYVLTSKDSIGVLYRLSTYHFGGGPQAIGDQLVQVAYGRKITGRLALQLAGGPEFDTFRVPVANQSSQIYESGSAALTYGFEHGGLNLGYSHGISPGSGILIGSVLDNFSFGANRQLGRVWNFSGSLGYARNSGLGASALGGTPNIDAWFVTAGLARALNPNASFSIGYTATIQSGSATTCGSVCNTNFTQHMISIGFQWNTRPFVIR